MAANIQLGGYPPVIRMKFFQASGADAGRAIIDTMVVGPASIEKMPRVTTLSINARNFTGLWPDMRLVKAPRVRNGYMRLVMEDSRWRLKENTLGQNYNERDTLGNVLTGQEKTVSELADLIGDAAGITVTAGDVVPLMYTGAKWAGATCYDAMKQLLSDTGCRLVFKPTDGTYAISHGGTGFLPDFPERIFRPGPDSNVKEITFYTAPVLYEDTLAASAIEISTTTGEAQALTTTGLPSSPTETYGQTRYRLWRPSAITHPEALAVSSVLLMDHRAKAHMFDPRNPMHERARIVRDSFVRIPVHQPLYAPGEEVTRLVELTGGGRAFLTDHPVLRTDNTGALLQTASLVTSYYVKEAATGKLRRSSKTAVIDANAATVIEKTIPWIKPVDSTLADMGGPVWSTVLDGVVGAVATPYKAEARTIRLSTPIEMNGSGHVGGVYYEFELRRYRPRIYFQVALNFTPGRQGAID